MVFEFFAVYESLNSLSRMWIWHENWECQVWTVYFQTCDSYSFLCFLFRIFVFIISKSKLCVGWFHSFEWFTPMKCYQFRRRWQLEIVRCFTFTINIILFISILEEHFEFHIPFQYCYHSHDKIMCDAPFDALQTETLYRRLNQFWFAMCIVCRSQLFFSLSRYHSKIECLLTNNLRWAVFIGKILIFFLILFLMHRDPVH